VNVRVWFRIYKMSRDAVRWTLRPLHKILSVSAEVSQRHFGTDTKKWDISVPKLQCWTVLGPKCLGSEVSIHPPFGCVRIYEEQPIFLANRCAGTLQEARKWTLMKQKLTTVSRVTNVICFSAPWLNTGILPQPWHMRMMLSKYVYRITKTVKIGLKIGLGLGWVLGLGLGFRLGFRVRDW